MSDALVWGNSLKSAIQSAVSENKLVLVNFSNPS